MGGGVGRTFVGVGKGSLVRRTSGLQDERVRNAEAECVGSAGSLGHQLYEGGRHPVGYRSS